MVSGRQMQNAVLLKKVNRLIRRFPFWRRRDKARGVKKIGTGGALSRQKQAELEMLCFKLFENRELVTSGRLQLIGLAKVKKRMGRRWAGMQQVIYEICEDTIKKYIVQGDLYIRFGEDSYMLLFGVASVREGELKAALIAEEIKRRLFEEEGIDDMAVSSQMSRIQSRDVGRDKPFPQSIKIAFDRGAECPQPANMSSAAAPVPPATTPRAIEVEAYTETLNRSMSLDLGVRMEEIPFRDVHYLPVWDQSKGRLIAHLCLAKGAEMERPIDGHRAFYAGARRTERANMDLAVLARIIGWMKDNPEKLAGFGIICPVHYDTILGVEGEARYRALCQRVDERMKQYLLFMVLDLPPAVPWPSLTQVVSPLKTYGRVLCGQVPLSCPVDFEAMRLAGFDNVGIIMPPSNINRRVDVSAFVIQAKKHLIHKTFVLGIDDPHVAADVAAAGVHYLGGKAIHVPICNPAVKPAFEEYPFCRIWGRAGGHS